MMDQLISPLLLVTALALSWPRFVGIFSVVTSAALAAGPLTMIASTVSLAAFGLAFSGSGPWLGACIAGSGLLLGAVARQPAPAVGIVLSAISLAAYLRISATVIL